MFQKVEKHPKTLTNAKLLGGNVKCCASTRKNELKQCYVNVKDP